jgi:DNA-directed RNA polymerase subunit F
MAFTGKKERGSRILTPETVENAEKLYEYMESIKKINPDKHERLVKEMFGSMFQYLSHSAQKEILEWAVRAEWNVLTEQADKERLA